MNWISHNISWINKISLCLHKICGLWQVPWFCFSFFIFWNLVELWNCVLVLFCQFSRKFILWLVLFCCNIILFVLLNLGRLEGSLFWFFLCFLRFLFCYNIPFVCFLEFKKLEGLFLKSLSSFPLCYLFISITLWGIEPHLRPRLWDWMENKRRWTLCIIVFRSMLEPWVNLFI
jgi:hypothetical protein